ncbi:type V CRISPR-associated protein Cpf1 [Candidatus Uhrbacteria bacterium CG_4_9_14_3_um_filter_41_35]|uniref:Type V CRISPR-associated protein Cpf1 n=1 Tax=Candidatus Uhrbacteria bacterium CG_4_9_14_3_um_filter_41_35 TaxID=1975034 RepID=A0A2M7XDN6_9BACT|nr:MAG: type V CRISPR-associated protein Cpf1 [Candidatus Uhrbacteria bacterium CG11_big_fil_rev_8_21_14_0_20_41_9]PJA45989.1 MAG: type V CRISPR-associated protein Cpf1 [Candidatus Uhrbacteria bacterium CG_4_9_14_3_um_filter_41_35]
MKDFYQFTNLYALSKTLRFSLIPTPATKQMLEDAKVFEKDETIQKKYEATKPYFDRLHREFALEALQDQKLDFKNYLELYRKYKADKKASGKLLINIEKDLRKEVVKLFDKQGEKWAKQYPGLKNKNIGVLFKEAVFTVILKERYGNEKETQILDESSGQLVSIFDSWKGFIGYFKKFHETRKNFYKDDGTSTALATRIIDQNLKRFCDNILIFESTKEKVDFSEVEISFGKPLSEVFTLEFYNTCFLQNGIDFYTKILGGETLQNGEKVKGLNECINLHKQKTGEKLPFFKSLDKQILSEKDKFFIDEISNETQLLEVLKSFVASAESKTDTIKTLVDDFVKDQDKYDLNYIYFSNDGLNTITRKWTTETQVFEEALYTALKAAKVVSSSAKKNEGGYSFPDFIPFAHLKTALESIKIDGTIWRDNFNAIENFEEKSIWAQFLAIYNFELSNLFETEIKNPEIGNCPTIGYNVYKQDFEELLKSFVYDPNAKVTIKNFADNVLSIYQMAKYFAVEKKRGWNTDYELDVFYTDPQNGYLQYYENAYEEIVQVYNKLRNYLTKKPYSEEKWKLNFDSGTPIKYTTRAIIFNNTTNERYYLGLLKKGVAKPREFEPINNNIISSGEFRRMIIQQLKFQTLAGKGYVRDFGVKYSEDKDGVKHLQQLIKKQYLSKYPCLKKIADGVYNDKKAFDADIKDVLLETYNLDFQPISEEFILNKNRLGEIYLFEIHNKDWNLKDGKNKSGSKNLHTMYFESLFVDKTTFKLNNEGAEVFYRPATNEGKLGTKKDRNGKIIINHKRYATDKILFHCPIGLNKDAGKSYTFNAKINNMLANNPDINIIGVDRGEKHLAYYSVITQKGKILDRGSLNKVEGGDKQEIDYAKKLEETAKNREQARKDWQAVEGIKDLKRGYISQVVRKLADLAIEHNAIIVFEDLNMRFKQIRGGIEKSVYQQLEKALIDKLSFLVMKGEADPEKAGHLLKAYQLVAPFESFQSMGKQTGIIFYTQANYTSKIDPITGWRPNLYLKYTSAEKAKADILKFSKIEFVNNRFELTYDIKNFVLDKKVVLSNKTKWTVCSSVERFRWNRRLESNQGNYEHYENLTENLSSLFKDFGFEIEQNIIRQVEQLATKGNEQFFRSFIFYVNLIFQIRNTDAKAKDQNKEDFILSPVEPFFDSRTPEKFGENLPENGDDNGAFNIARKGIIMLNKISAYKQEVGNVDKIIWKDLFISAAEWDNFTQE